KSSKPPFGGFELSARKLGALRARLQRRHFAGILDPVALLVALELTERRHRTAIGPLAAHGVHERDVQLVDRHVAAARSGVSNRTAVRARAFAVAAAYLPAFHVHDGALLQVAPGASGDDDWQV